MVHGKIQLPLTRDLEKRLARRRSIEAGFREGKTKQAHGDSLLLREHVAAPVLRTVLQMVGLYSRGTRNALAPIVRRLRFEFHDLPPDFEGFRILHLTDLHIDGIDGLAEIVSNHVRGLEADLCVMTGDYRFHVEGPCDGVYPRLRTILSSIRARHSVIAILGNHDESEMAVELEKLGVRTLINDAIAIARGDTCLWMLGVDDPHRYGCGDLDGALETVPANAFKVLLAHSPEMYRQASTAGIHLYLCGHTHAGQIRVPGIGALLMNAACPRSYTQGRWRYGPILRIYQRGRWLLAVAGPLQLSSGDHLDRARKEGLTAAIGKSKPVR